MQACSIIPFQWLYKSSSPTRKWGKETSVFPTHISAYVQLPASLFSQRHMHEQANTLISWMWYIYIFFYQFACLSEYKGPKEISSWLAVHLWKSFFCIASSAKSGKKNSTVFSSMVSSISNSLTVDQSVRVSRQTHKGSNTWHLSGYRQMSSLKLFTVLTGLLCILLMTSASPSWVSGWLLW